MVRRCCICGRIIDNENDAEPFKKGKCCDSCFMKHVLPAKINIITKQRRMKKLF